MPDTKKKPIHKKPVVKKQTEKIEAVRLFGYELKNGKKGQVRASNVEEAYEAVRQIATSFGIHDRKCWYDFYEITT